MIQLMSNKNFKNGIYKLHKMNINLNKNIIKILMI